METETHTTTLADVTRLQAEVKELLEKYAAGDVEGLEDAQRDAVLQHLRDGDGDLDRLRQLLAANNGFSSDNSAIELIERLVSAVASHTQMAAANMATQDDAAQLGRALLDAGMAPQQQADRSLEEISGLTPPDREPPAQPSTPTPAPGTGGAPGLMDTLRQLTAGSSSPAPRSRSNATPDNRATAANDLRRRPDQLPDPLESRLIGLVSATEALAKAQNDLLSSDEARAQMSARNEAGRAAIAKILPSSPGYKQYGRRCRTLRKAQAKVLRRAEAMAQLQLTRPDLFGPANLEKNQYHYNRVLGLQAGGSEQIKDKLRTMTDDITDPKIDNLVGADGQKLGPANKLFLDRLQGIGHQLSAAIERIWDTVTARLSQGPQSKSDDMGQQPGMSPG